MNKTVILTLATAALLMLSAACTTDNYLLPVSHPPLFEMGQRREFCTKCHAPGQKPIDFERYNHTPAFTLNHRMVAYQDEQVCALCHSQAFCSDCHATRVELKPSIKNQTENFRQMQHRGDYLTRHRIEGRIDPSSCYRCHGAPSSAATCRPCHG